MTNDLKSALTIVYGDIVAVNEKADTNATNIESNTSNIETLQTQVSTNTSQLSTNTSNIETLQQEVANLKASASGVLYNESVESGVGYELSVSENALPYGTMDIVGGMSYKSDNLLVLEDVAETTTNGITYKVENGVITLISGTATTGFSIYVNCNELNLNGECYLKDFYTTYYSSAWWYLMNNATQVKGGNIGNGNTTLTFTNNVINRYRLYISENVDFNNVVLKPMLIKGTTAPTEYSVGFEGIRNTQITSVVSKDSNDNLLATGEIPSEIQALTGYGWGISQSVCNYIDFENKKFVQKVGRVDLGDLTWNAVATGTSGIYRMRTVVSDIKMPTSSSRIANILCAKYDSDSTSSSWVLIKSIGVEANNSYVLVYDEDYNTSTSASDFKTAMSGVYLYYELATPIETDISYITDNTMQFGAGGTIKLENDYGQEVPYQYTILEKVSE